MAAQRSHKPLIGQVQILLPQPLFSGHSLIGKAADLYSVLAADYRKIIGSNTVAPIRFLLKNNPTKTNADAKICKDKRMLKIPFFCLQ